MKHILHHLPGQSRLIGRLKAFISLTLLVAVLAVSAQFTWPASASAASGTSQKAEKYSDVYTDCFDTVISFIAFADSPETFASVSGQVHALYQYLHKLYDRYNSYESEGIINIYTLNARAAKEPVQVDPILYALLTFSKKHYSVTEGQTNIAMGNLLGIWHEYRERGFANPSQAELPEMSLLESASRHSDIDNLILDDDNMTVYFADPELQLDVGAVAKGYATEIVAKMLENTDVSSYIISAGGNVRLGHGPLDGRPNWGIGIQSPDGPVFAGSEVAEILYLSDCSVVTSGDYQRYYEVDGVRYCHLIDPDTLMPGDTYRAVTIVAEDSGYADLLSTAAYLMPYETSRAFIDSLPDVEAIWIFPDGTELMTDGITAHAKSRGASNDSGQ
ncbi:MAG: FAD:protein FMN transferase [Clostridia bacterium]|nr:FAD:protein FMN transferase [Clostridia bacterium]